MKRLTILGLMLSLAGAACAGHGAVSLGPAPSGAPRTSVQPISSPSLSQSPTPSTTPSPSTAPSTQPPAGHVTVQVWFVRSGKLFQTKRTEAATVAVARLAMTKMLEGPSSTERAVSAGTEIPAGTSLRGITIANGTATVDLSSSFGSSTTRASMGLRIAQVVYTLTQFSTVKGVRFHIDGVARTTVGGVPVQQDQTRSMWDGDLPAILVDSPTPGAAVSCPVTVTGTANVFEAQVNVRVLDENGREVAKTFTLATCGTGCRGRFSVSVTYHVSHEQQGIIEVLDYSAKDGSPENVYDVPVTLTA